MRVIPLLLELLAVLVVWWFLREWRATLVAAAALPLSAIPTFLGLHYFGYTLNTVTLLSLALVVGGEGKGLRPLVRQHCDLVVSLPMPGAIESLTAAVAGSML